MTLKNKILLKLKVKEERFGHLVMDTLKSKTERKLKLNYVNQFQLEIVCLKNVYKTIPFDIVKTITYRLITIKSPYILNTFVCLSSLRA